MTQLRAENFVSYRLSADRRGLAAADLETVATMVTEGRPASVVNDLRARRILLGWSAALEAADDLFDARRFEEALAAYERLSLRLLALIQPEVGYVRNPVRWLEGGQVTAVMVEAATGLLNHILPNQSESAQVFVKRSDVVNPEELGGQLFAGIRSTGGLPDEVAGFTVRAAAAMEEGDWESASALYERALGAMPNAQQADRADLLLNLGALDIQLERMDDGLARLEQARELYLRVGDDLGAAEALHNRGLAQLRAGDATEARATLKRARKAAESATLRGLLKEPAESVRHSGDQEDASNGGSSNGGSSNGGSSNGGSSNGSGSNGGSSNDGGSNGGGSNGGGSNDGGSNGDRTNGGGIRRLGALLTRGSSTLPRVLTRTGGIDTRVLFGSGADATWATARATEPVDTDELAASIGSDDLVLRMRSVGRGAGLPMVKLDTPAQERGEAFNRTLALADGGNAATLTWSPDRPLDPGKLADVLQARVALTDLRSVGFRDREIAETAVGLPHLYNLTLPIKIADCLSKLSRFAAAHEQYGRASRYELINTALEAPDLWRRMAENVVAWGDSLFQEDQSELALPVYGLLMTETFQRSDSILYAGESLAPTGTAVGGWLDAVRAGTDPPELNPALVHLLLIVRKRWTYLNAGLDFFGTPANVVTPFSFRYLQDVARYLAQRASQAEQRYVEYYTRYESGQMSRLELTSTVQQAELGIELAAYNQQSASRTAQAAAAASDLADLRASNAQSQLDEFNDVAWELTQLAGHIARGNAWTGGDLPNLHYSAGGRYDFDGPKHEVLQDLTRRQSEIGNDLQASRMQDAIGELNQARIIAAAQEGAAQARAAGAAIESQIAQARAQHANEMLEAFNDQRFDPEQWLAMANLMQALALSALDQATEVARLMQKAYNFENFDDRHVVRTSYRSTAAGNLLGGEILLSDIDGFTHYHVTQVREKPIPVKLGLSLAEEYPGQFLGLQSSGIMEFDVDLSRLALSHPGTYRHRLVAAELEVDGFIPPTGLRGRLTNSGLGRYRDSDGASTLRVQPAETLVLSRYSRRDDALLLSPPQEMRGLFEGNSVASGWTLELPRMNNDVDLHLVFDLRLVLYFDCLFDRDLFRADSTAAPGITFHRNRALHLAQHAPDAYFQLREAGAAELELRAGDFPHNQPAPVLTSLALGAVPGDSTPSLAGVELEVTYPGQPTPVQVTLDAQGSVPSAALPVSPGASALGDYKLELAEADLPRRADLDDVVLVLGYEFTPA